MAGVAIAAMAISSCDEGTDVLGTSLTSAGDRLELSTTSYAATTKTVLADSVLSLTSTCYFGRIKDPETGADVTSEFSTQFHVLEDTYISPESKLVGTYNGRCSADSCDITLFLSSPFKANDTLVAMKMQMSELKKPVEEGQKFYSNYDPSSLGLIRTDGIKSNKMFTFNTLTDTDSLRNTDSYRNNIRLKLNEPYTAQNGKTYNNYGTYILHQYYDHPEYFKNNYSFIHYVCPGFFFEVTDGYGLHAKVSYMALRVYYTLRVNADSTQKVNLIFAGTKEVLQTTKVTNDKKAIQALANETAHTYLKCPAGLYTEVTLPVDEIKATHTNDSLVSAAIAFQRINNQSFDYRSLNTPQALLMVQKDSLTNFFEKYKVNDNRSSYYTSFSSSYNTYTFNNIASMISKIWHQKNEGLKNDPNWVANHPNWNKVLLVPITYSTSTSSSTPISIEHDMSLCSTRLIGGPSSPIEIKVVYGKYKE